MALDGVGVLDRALDHRLRVGEVAIAHAQRGPILLRFLKGDADLPPGDGRRF